MEIVQGNPELQAELLERSQRVFAGGSVSRFNLPPEVAFVVARGKGSHVWDMAGREYIDFLLGSGPMILGHAHPAVVEAVREQATRGSQFFSVTEPALKLAEEIARAVPCAEKLRFTCSGAEATFYSLRLARAFTGRDKILKFEGAYHGHHDYAMIGVTPSSPVEYPWAEPDTGGIPRSLLGEVLVAPFNDLETTVAIIEKHARELAAVIVEPLQRMIRPKPGFLQALRTVTRDLGILLVYDEVVTGFRLAYGGGQQHYGVVPDIAAFGKIIGGGYPVAVVAGRADVMALCEWKRQGLPDYVYFSGTLSGNAVAAAAGLATLTELRTPGTYESLWGAGQKLKMGLETVLRERGIPGQVLAEGPLFRILFTDRPIESYRDVMTADRKLAQTLSLELVRRGFYVNGTTHQYISTAHSDEDLDRLIGATAEVLKEIT